MGVRGIEYRVAHLNGDPLDCRRENLVVRTHAEQKAAMRKMAMKAGRETSSRFKGVSRRSPRERWVAAITAYGEHRPLGRFRSEVGAALAYDDVARELFGEHALNFPDPDEAARMRVLATEEGNAPLLQFPPPGMIDRRGACRMFGISYETWQDWENNGRVPGGRWVPRPFGKPGGRCKVYAVEELKRLLEEFSRIGKPYPDPDRPGCLRVPIRSWIHRMEAIIDARDLCRWWRGGGGIGPRTPADGTAASPWRPPGRRRRLCRIIAGVSEPQLKVSHVNRDPLDCRRQNLIVRTMAEQAPANRKMGTVNGRKYTSKYKGVSWSEGRGKWVAQITRGDMHRHIGRFDDELAAAEAYDEAARELFGEHAYLNFANGIDAALAPPTPAEARPPRAAA
jgi:hypothetical protein